MLIFRQREFGAYPATWGKELISLAKKGKMSDIYSREGNCSKLLELKRFRRDLKPTGGCNYDILASKERYIRDVIEPTTERTGRSFKDELSSRKNLMRDVIAAKQERAASEGPQAYKQFKRIKNAVANKPQTRRNV